MSDADINGAMMTLRTPALGSNISGGANGVDRSAPRSKDEEFTFGDLLSAINPLQHLPIISTAYRALTGDEIKPAARMLGGALYGGPIGLLSAFANNLVEAETGKDIGANALALAGYDTGSKAPASLAAGDASPTTAAGPPADGLSAGEAPSDGPLASAGNGVDSLPDQPDAFAGIAAADAGAGNALPAAVQRTALSAAPSATPSVTTTATATANQTQTAAAPPPAPSAEVLPSQADPFAFAYGRLTAQEGAPDGGVKAANVARLPTDPRETMAATQRDADAFAALRAADAPKSTQTARNAEAPPDAKGNNWFGSAFSRGFDQYRKAAKPQATGPDSSINLTI